MDQTPKEEKLTTLSRIPDSRNCEKTGAGQQRNAVGGVTVIWVSPSFGHPRTQTPSDMGIPGRDAQNTDNIKYSRLGQVNSFEVLKTKCCLNIWFINRVDD